MLELETPEGERDPLGSQARGKLSSELFSSICFMLGASLLCGSEEGSGLIFINELLIKSSESWGMGGAAQDAFP